MVSTQGSRLCLECSDAFELTEADRRAALRLTTTKLLDNDVALARGETQPNKPVTFVPDEGRTPYDLVGTTYAIIVLVSARFVDLLVANGIDGWSTFPVTVATRDSGTLDDYHGFAVTGRCGAIDDRLSERVVLPPPVPEGREAPGLRGLCFPPETWDGSDIFTPDDAAFIFVTERVKDTIQEAGLTNVLFRRLSEIKRTIYPRPG